MALRTQPADSLPQRGAANRITSDRRLRLSERLSQRLPFYWLLISVFLTLGSVAISALLLQGGGESDRGSVAFNFATLGVALLLSFLVGILQPAWWRRALVVAAAVPVPILLATSGNLVAGATVVGLLLPLTWLGRECASLLHRRIDRVDAWVIGGAFGVSVLGALGLVLGMTGNLRAQFIWPVPAIVLLYLVATRRHKVGRDLTGLLGWLKRPVERQPIVLLLAGITLGCFWLNLIGALAPEMRPDATRQRLATAVAFARAGTLTLADPDLTTANTTALGEMIYAVAVAAGPLQSAKLLNWLVGLACAAAVFALGRRTGGTWSGSLAAFAFYDTLLVAYLSQTAYLDLFTTLFVAAAALCLMIGGGAQWRTGLLAGIFIGLGVVTKPLAGYIAIGLAVSAIILALKYGWRRAVVHAMIVTVAAMLAAGPWMYRSYALTGSIPGVGAATTTLSNVESGQLYLKDDRANYGYGQSLGHLLTAPLTATLASRQFGGSQLISPAILGGHSGFLLLGLVPLLAIRIRRRAVALVAGAAIAGVFWFYTMPYIRYAVPIVALLCAGGASIYVAIWRNTASKHNRAAMNALLGILALTSTFVTLQLPATAQRLAFGLQSNEAYLSEWLGPNGAGSYAILRLLASEPGATRAFALHDGARLYSDVRISNPWTTGSDLAINDRDDVVLARLQAGGYSHIMVDRIAWWGSNWSWDKLSVINEDFLRRNTVLVGGGDYSYLYRIVPPEQRGTVSWVRGAELIPNGDFEASGFGNWLAVGSPRIDSSGTQSHTGAGAVALSVADQLRTEVPVTPNTLYLLANATRSNERYGGAKLFIEWRDAQGNKIDTTWENIPVSPDGYHTFSMLAAAPANATAAVVYAKVYSGTVWFDDFSLRVAALATAP